MDLNIFITIVPLVITIYLLYRRYINFDITPDKDFNKLVKQFNKIVNINFDVQTNKLKLSIFKSILMDEHLLILALTNETSNKLLITNTTLHNRGYDPIKNEFLLMSKEVLEPDANINISIYIWLTKDLGIRYEIYDDS